MYIFISHCVRDNDGRDVKNDKETFVNLLENNGFIVFDYAYRPGRLNNWRAEIKLQLCNSSALVYFAKQWPEPDPGVVLLEMGAAYMMGIPIWLFSREGYQPNQPIFSGYSERFSPALIDSADIVHENAEELLGKLRAPLERRNDDAGRAFQTLTDVFIRHKEPARDSSLDKTAIIMESIHVALRDRDRNGLGLRRLVDKDTYQQVSGYWRIPSHQVIVAVKKPGSDHKCSIRAWRYKDKRWQAEGEFTINSELSHLLDGIHTIGYVACVSGVCILVGNNGEWWLFTKDTAKQVTAPDELKRASRRTCIHSLDNGVSGFFADGRFYRIDLSNNRICVEPTYRTSVVLDDFYLPPSADAPARLATIHGAKGCTALVKGGRVEAIGNSDADEQMGGMYHFGDKLSLGTWKPISRPEVLRSLRTQSIQADNFNEIRTNDQLNWLSNKDAFEWYRAFISEYRQSFTLASCYYNDLSTGPVIYECDDEHLDLFEENLDRLVYHKLDLKWEKKRRDQLWEVIGTRV
ncbi:MAG: hypothetical protein ACREX4_09010 [Gammaproteobacteria bacterium]